MATPELPEEQHLDSHQLELGDETNSTATAEEHISSWQSQNTTYASTATNHVHASLINQSDHTVGQIPSHMADLNFMFFDPAENVQGQHDLNWLFEGALSDLDFDRGSILNGPSTVSPMSTTSCQLATRDLIAPEDAWVAVQSRLIPALSTIPPSLLGSTFFEPANLQDFCRLYFNNYNSHSYTRLRSVRVKRHLCLWLPLSPWEPLCPKMTLISLRRSRYTTVCDGLYLPLTLSSHLHHCSAYKHYF